MTESQIVRFLREERIRQGITYRQFQRLSGLPQSTIGRFELRQSAPMLKTVLTYVDVLGLELKME